MDIALKLISAGVVSLLLGFPQHGYAQSDVSNYSQKTLLKNWAFSRCLGQVYKDEKTKDDANSSAAAYLEYGHQPITAYEKLDVLVARYASRKYSGSVDSQFNTMKCIDLLYSKELDELVGKLLSKKRR